MCIRDRSDVDLQQQLNDRDKDISEMKQQIENSDATIKMLKETVQRLKSQLLSTTAKPETMKEPVVSTATSFHPIGLGPGMSLTNMYIHIHMYTKPGDCELDTIYTRTCTHTHVCTLLCMFTTIHVYIHVYVQFPLLCQFNLQQDHSQRQATCTVEKVGE